MPVHAASPWVPNPGVSSKDSYLIVDAQSGRDLAADRPDELRHPASLTKLMTLYLTFSALDSGTLSLGDALPVSVNALNAPPTKMGMPGGMTAPLMSQIGIGGVLEFAGGILIMLGLGTRLTAFILSGEMAVAYWQFHAPKGFWPIVNGGGEAAIYCFVFLFFSAAGAGPWSLDAWREGRRKN